MCKAPFSLKLTKLAVLNALSGQQSKGGNAALQNAVVSLLKARGADAHVYMPGPGVPILGPELVVNGGFDDATGWYLGAWSVTGGKAVASSLGAWASIGRPIPAVKGRSYIVTMVVSSYTSGGVYAQIGTFPDAQSGTFRTAVGTYTEILTTPANSSLIEIYSNGSGFSGSVDSISVREILGYTNYLNGFAAGNYIESTGNTNAAVDSAVGLVLDAAGSVGADKTPAGTAWSGYNANLSSATLPATATSTAAVNYGIRFSTLTVGKTYRAKVSWSGNNSGRQIKADAAGLTTLGNAVSGSGTVVFTATDPYHYIYVTGTGAVGESFTINSVETCEIPGTHATQTTTANKPTLRRGIVNLALNNGSPNGASYSRINATVTENYATAPDGTQTAHRLQITAANGALQQSRPELDTKTYSQAVWVKSNTGANQQFQWWNGTATITGTATTEWQLVCSGASLFTTGSRFDFGSPTNGADLLIWRPGLFQGTLTAQQILAAGGIPLTTTAPASSQYGAYAWQFDGGNDFLALPGPLFQMADDHFVLVAAARGYGAGGYKAPFFPAGNLSTTARAGVIGIDPTGNITGYYTNDAGSFFVPTLGTVAYGEAFVATMANRSGSVNGRKNGGNLSNTVNPSGACTLNAAGVGTAQGFSYFDGMLFLAISIKGTVSAAEERALTKWAGSIAGVPIA